MEKLKELLLEKLGYEGRMISGSKGGYCNRYPDNLPIFNANLCTVKKSLFKKTVVKVWYGDIDITESRNLLREIAIEANMDIFVLREMDARFGNEKKPLLDRFVYCAKSNGTEELGKFEESYYELGESLKRKSQIK
jgi:hypothetical protein